MSIHGLLTCKAPNTAIAEFANTVDHNETSHLDLQCLPSIVFQDNTVNIESF